MKSIRVIGLTDVERHALNSVVRLSMGRNPSYTIWQQGEGRPDILLLDGRNEDASKVAQSDKARAEHMVWIGADVPEFVHYSVQRPVQWAQLLTVMDDLIGRVAPTLPAELDASVMSATSLVEKALATREAVLQAAATAQGKSAPDSNSPIALSDFNVSGTGESGDSVPMLYLHGDDSLGRAPDKRRHVLIVDDNEHFRMYLKAVLSVGGEIVADESANAEEALQKTQNLAYDSVLVGSQLGGGKAAARGLCASILSTALNLRPGDTRISRPNVFFLVPSSSWFSRWQAKRLGASGILIRPRNQEQLDALFAAVNRYAQG